MIIPTKIPKFQSLTSNEKFPHLWNPLYDQNVHKVREVKVFLGIPERRAWWALPNFI